MSVMSLANSLMLDFRCLIIPRFVYFTGEAFEEGKVTDQKVEGRVSELAKELYHICTALNKKP
jgi:FMN reductase